MFLVSVDVLLCCIFICVSSTTAFGNKLATKEGLLDEKVSQMTEWSSRRSVVRLDGQKFRKYVDGAPRNYSVVVMLTALAANRACQVCHQAHDEFTIVANSWRFSQAWTTQLYFALADFDDASDVFQLLNQNSAPVIIHFPPSGVSKRPADTMDIQRSGFSSEAVAHWIQERTDIQIRVFRPPSYSGTIVLVALMLMGAAVLYVKRNSLDFLYNRTVWGIAALTLIFAMLSGQMWNHIRGPPLMHKNPQTGELAYIYPSSDFQFVFESLLVFLLYTLGSLSLILLAEANDVEDETKRKWLVLGSCGSFLVLFSFIVSLFRAKNQGYPYRLLFG